MSGRRGRGSFSDFDPFAGFGGLGGMGGPQSMISSFFGGRDPFDDPFFTRPFGSSFGSMFESSFFGGNGSPFSGAPQAGFVEQQESQPNKRRGPVIQELDSDDEHAEDGGDMKTKDNSRKHSKLAGEPYVEIPDDASDGAATDARNIQQYQHRNELNNRMNNAQHPSQSHCYTFQSSTVSYGGANGACYSKSMAKRAGSDGVVFEELKEADSTTGQANHRISRGIHNKGHTLARKLNSDGRVDTRQMLHNLNQDELDGFEKAWEGSAGRHLTGGRLTLDGVGNSEPGSRGQSSRECWALPSTQLQENNVNLASGNNATHMQQTGQRAANHGAHMRSTGKKTADRGSHGRKRA